MAEVSTHTLTCCSHSTVTLTQHLDGTHTLLTCYSHAHGKKQKVTGKSMPSTVCQNAERCTRSKATVPSSCPALPPYNNKPPANTSTDRFTEQHSSIFSFGAEIYIAFMLPLIQVHLARVMWLALRMWGVSLHTLPAESCHLPASCQSFVHSCCRNGW